VHSATRLAQILVELRHHTHTDLSDDPSLLDRLEAHLAITDDVEARKALATYLNDVHDRRTSGNDDDDAKDSDKGDDDSADKRDSDSADKGGDDSRDSDGRD
jgi:hypothetical protein